MKLEIQVEQLNQLKIEIISFVVVKHKKEINKQYNAYRNDFISKLRNLKTNDPKSYWSLLNKTTDENKAYVNKVALETFYDHFKNLNNINNDNNDFNFYIQTADVNDNCQLNKSSLRMTYYML